MGNDDPQDEEDIMIIKKYALILLCLSSIILFSSYGSAAKSSVPQKPSPDEPAADFPQMTVGDDWKIFELRPTYASTNDPEKITDVERIIQSLSLWDPSLEGVSYAAAKAGSLNNEQSKIKVQSDKIKIGIIEFQSLNEEAKKDILGKVFSEVLTTSFVNSEAFKIIEREQLEKVLKELQLTQTGIVDTAYAKQIGKMVGADAILTGTVIKFGTDLRVDARIIDVESGIILTAEKTMGKADLKSISAMADSMVQNLVNRFYRGKK